MPMQLKVPASKCMMQEDARESPASRCEMQPDGLHIASRCGIFPLTIAIAVWKGGFKTPKRDRISPYFVSKLIVQSSQELDELNCS